MPKGRKKVQKDAKWDHISPEKIEVQLRGKAGKQEAKWKNPAAADMPEKKFLEVSLGRESSMFKLKEMHI